MHDGEEWEVLELGDEVGEKELGEKRIRVEVAWQVEENLDEAIGSMEEMDGREVQLKRKDKDERMVEEKSA